MKSSMAGKLALLGLLVGVTIVLGLFYSQEARATRSALRAAPPIEYLVIREATDLGTKEHLAQFNAELNALGKEGWDLIPSRSVFIFKRPKQ